jgi:hypothetical protein
MILFFRQITLTGSLIRVIAAPLLVRAMRWIGWIKAWRQKQKYDGGGTKTATVGLRQTIRRKARANTLKHKPIRRMLKGIVGHLRPKLNDVLAQAVPFLIG